MPWGSMTIKQFDPEGKLKKPLSDCWQIWCPNDSNLLLGIGNHSIKVVVDENNILAELEETNNSITRTVNCKPIIQKVIKKK